MTICAVIGFFFTGAFIVPATWAWNTDFEYIVGDWGTRGLIGGVLAGIPISAIAVLAVTIGDSPERHTKAMERVTTAVWLATFITFVVFARGFFYDRLDESFVIFYSFPFGLGVWLLLRKLSGTLGRFYL